MTGQRTIALRDPAREMGAIASNTSRYRELFKLFLARTDEKRETNEFLKRFFARLPTRGALVDAGAGTGALIAQHGERFERVIAVEPSPELARELANNCSWAELHPSAIVDTQLSPTASCVVCSHVLYYVPRDQWQEHVERCLSWLSTAGVGLFILQARESDYQRLTASLLGEHWAYDLTDFATSLAHDRGLGLQVQHVPAQVRTEDLNEAVDIAEFMCSYVPTAELQRLVRIPTRRDLADWLVANCLHADTFVMSCEQAVVQLRPGMTPSLA